MEESGVSSGLPNEVDPCWDIIAISDEAQFLETLKDRTLPGGVHHLLTTDSPSGVLAFAPEALKACYADWHVERTRSGQSRGLIAVKP